MLRERKNKRYNETNDEDTDRKFNLMEQIKSRRFDSKLKEKHLLELSGHEITLKLIQKHGFEKPILVPKPTGLDLKVPTKNFLVRDVKSLVGDYRIIDVMDVKTQKNIEMSMSDWCKYYESKNRDRLLNVISLEFSHTKLDDLVVAPIIVRILDWVDLVWPKCLKESQIESTNNISRMKYPKVQKYCLMSVKGSYTDFHIDFGGTSVWYHILRGKKIFWMVPPTELNLQVFEEWTLSGMQQDVFFGDTVEECFKVELVTGNTFFIPSGWIHAVYTLEDSLVFGGNFLHSYGIENQLKVSKIEDATKVPIKFRYPFYTEILWYLVQHYVYCLTDKDHLHRHELEAIEARRKEEEREAAERLQQNSIDIEDATTESDHDNVSDITTANNNEKKKTAKRTLKKKSSVKRKNSNKKKAKKPAQKKKKKADTSSSSSSDEVDGDDDDETDIDSGNEELLAKSKPAVNTCRMTKNSLIRLQYEVEEQHSNSTNNKSVEGSATKSTSKKKPAAATSDSSLVTATTTTTASLPTTALKQEELKVLQQNLAATDPSTTTLGLAEIMLSHESKLNGMSSSTGQSIWSNPNAESEKPKKIHLTKFEVNGLKVLVKHLSKLSGAKKNLPSLIRNSRALLDDCRKLIVEHENDDPELAVTGLPITPELLREPAKTDMNTLIGQFFKPIETTTENKEQPAKSNFKSSSPTYAFKKSRKVLVNNSAGIRNLAQSYDRVKVQQSSSDATDNDNQTSTSTVSINDKKNSNAPDAASFSPTKSSSPLKETKCLSPKKLSSNATSSSLNSSPPPRPKSPPTRPLSNNQYASKNKSSSSKGSNSNNNLLLPGSFADLIAATSTEKKVFDVSADVTSSLFGSKTPGSSKHSASNKQSTGKKKFSPLDSSKSNLSSKLPLDILISPPTTATTISGSSAGAVSSTSDKEASPSPTFNNNINELPKASTSGGSQMQKRFISPVSRLPQPNKEKLIYASAPYMNPVNTIDTSRSSATYSPWQTPIQNQPQQPSPYTPHQTPSHPQQIPPPYSPTVIKQNTHSGTSSQSPVKNQPSYSANQSQQQQPNSLDVENLQSNPQPQVPTDNEQKSNSESSLGVIMTSKLEGNTKGPADVVSLSNNNVDQANKIATNESKSCDMQINSNTSCIKPPIEIKSESSVIQNADNKPDEDAESKAKKPTKPRGPPKKSKEARQIIEMETKQQQDSTPAPILNLKSIEPPIQPSTSLQADQSNCNQPASASSNLSEPPATKTKTKKPKKSKDKTQSTSASNNQLLLQQQQQHQQLLLQQYQQQQFLQAMTPGLHQQSVICGLVRPPTTSTSSPGISGATRAINPQSYMITRPLMFNTMPNYSAAQFQLPQALPMFTAPVGAQLGALPPYQQGARIVWTTPPRSLQPNLTPLIATAPVPQGSSATSTSQSTKTSQASTSAAATTPPTSISNSKTSAQRQTVINAQLQHQHDNAALLSLATTALNAAPMASSPMVNHLTNSAGAGQRATIVSSAGGSSQQPAINPSTAALFATAGGQQFLTQPFLQRMPLGNQFMTTTGPTAAQGSIGGAGGVAPRPQTGQLVFARLPPSSQTAQPRYLITQPGFIPQRLQAMPHIATTASQLNHPGGLTTLAYATFKSPTVTDTTKAMKTKKVKTN